MKRGYLWLDWVELGCRGWDLENYNSCGVGAYLACSDITGVSLLYHRKVGFRLHVNASPSDTARAINDLMAAGMFWFVRQSVMISSPTNTTTGSTNTVTKWCVYDD